MPKESSSVDIEEYKIFSIMPVLSKIFEKIVIGKLSNFLEGNNLLPPSQFSYRSGLGTCDALLTLPHHLQVALVRGMERRLVQLDFSAALERLVTAVGCIS